METSKDTRGCAVFYLDVCVLLDPRHHEEEIMTWDQIGRCKEIEHMKLENGKTEYFAIQHATRYVDENRRCTYKEDADSA